MSSEFDIRTWFPTDSVGSFVHLKCGLVGVVTRVTNNAVYVAISNPDITADIEVFPDEINRMISREYVAEIIEPKLMDSYSEFHIRDVEEATR